MHWQCSRLIGWDNDSRRNIAILEALKWGADLIVTTDDDMIPIEPTFFSHFEVLFYNSFAGLKVGAPGWWVDTGQFTIPPARARGLPTFFPTGNAIGFVAGAEIGVAQGIILGKPDTDAMTNIVSDPVITGVHETLRAGFVVDLEARTVFNSQCTAFTRELAPAAAQFYMAERRNTDILASVIMRRIMREKNLYTHFGPPMAYHARNPHYYFQDLKNELLGIELITPLVMELEKTVLTGNVMEDLAKVYRDSKVLPTDASAAAKAWLKDCEDVL
jgi:hypothetical protein